ncbi:fungal-specific transcription factor domain-containing protein [Aspergillus cavernicola]|uniref:Fungal-specific transcription factor domain-containing protein n=1 Tax=Aspergillus cavernicola TaxID=176166 RepID=A0ABR4HVM4_9EURO
MENRKRHCWECLRLSLVCDFTEPECKRCSVAGVTCPGYGETKPLRLNWVAPGKVRSRTRKTKDKGPKTLGVPVNSAMYPLMVALNELGRHPGIRKIQPVHIDAGMTRPDFIRLNIVCMALNHRMNRAGDKREALALTHAYYHFRGLVLRSLNEEIRLERNRTRNVNVLIVGILSLLLADAHQGEPLHWRCHLQGVQQLIMLRGGLRAMTGPGIQPLLLCYTYVTVIGDTSSPASDLTMTTPLLAELITILKDNGDKPYSFYPFPTPLFAATVEINYLRARAISRVQTETETDPENFFQEAEQILQHIQSFHPEQWSKSRPAKPAWLLLARLMQAAVAIYCISSLSSLSLLSHKHDHDHAKTTSRKSLYTLLKQALSAPWFNGSLTWPLVVLGVDAVNDSANMRAFVKEGLTDLSYRGGSYVPLMAKGVLERYWAGGGGGWDVCFDRPYAMTMQWTVNRHNLR